MGVGGARARSLQGPAPVTKDLGSGTAWKGRPERAMAQYANPSSPADAHPEYSRARETRLEAGGTALQG